MRARSISGLLIASIFALGLTGVAQPATAEHFADESLAGCWEGSWYSCTSGHKGRLRATICLLSDGRYRASFSGTFFRIVPFRYSVVLTATEIDELVRFSGSSYLGRLAGGTYCYSGTADGSKFRATYRSKKDHGKFVMRKVGA